METGSTDNGAQNRSRQYDRRKFLKKTCMAAGVAGTIGSIEGGMVHLALGEELPGRMQYRRLGRTGLDISTVVVGEMPEPYLHERAFDLGVNYWHKMGNWTFPEVFTKRDRDSFYCDMVVDTLNKDGAIAHFEWGLQNSGLEMIDFMKVHSLYREPEEVERGEGLFQAFEELKKQGKTRFLSVAQHNNTAEVLTACIESGHFDAIQPNFNALSGQGMHDMISLAEKHDVGVICKKVMVGGGGSWNRRQGLMARVERYLDNDTTMGQALMRWALDIPGVTAVVPRITTIQHLEENVAAGFKSSSGTQVESTGNRRAVEVFTREFDRDYCRSCTSCERVCPAGIQISDIFRCEVYHSGYGLESEARSMYAGFQPERSADKCNACGECETVCPHGLPIIEKLVKAHRILA